jgi:tRNA C32,U32 (ribose-2'-O)-methylase TrmJ
VSVEPDFTNTPPPEGHVVDRHSRKAIARALNAFAMHEAARARHAAVAQRLRDSEDASRILVATTQRMRDHFDAGRDAMQALRDAVRAHARAQRAARVPPREVLALVKADLADILAAIPRSDAVRDPVGLSTQILQWVSAAYYEAA